MAKISWTGESHVSDAVLARNQAYARSLGLPLIEDRGEGAVAVVGGGPSLPLHLDALYAWDGEIWGINGAWGWLQKHGIEATLYRIDPSPAFNDKVSGCKRAVLADTCDPGLFDALKGADVELARIGKGEILHGTTAASTAPILAAHRGNSHVCFFGCEGNFGPKSHAYKCDKGLSSLLDVKCGGIVYETSPQMIMQTELLAGVARELKGYVTVAGEGFLPALIEHGDYDVIAVSRDLAERLGESDAA